MKEENLDAAPSSASDARINLVIFEQLLGASRQKLDGDQCGLVYANTPYPCFAGHDRFDDAPCWEAHYQGPDFCGDLSWVFVAQAAAARVGLMEEYMAALVKSVCPHWNSLQAGEEVVRFWYSLAAATPRQRALALLQAIQWRGHLEYRAERAIALALQLADAEDEHWDLALQSFLAFVQNLTLEQAQELLAVMYLGRGDHATFEATLRVVSGSADNPQVIARRMAGKGPLAKYLTSGLVKWRVERAPSNGAGQREE